MTDTKSVFETILRNRIKLKDVPNTEFVDGTFRIGDYFDRRGFRESHEDGESMSEADVDGWVEWAFDPWLTYCAGIPEIELDHSINNGWIDVEVEIPNDESRQELLASVIVDAWELRKLR